MTGIDEWTAQNSEFLKASRVYHLCSYQYRTLLTDSMQSKLIINVDKFCHASTPYIQTQCSEKHTITIFNKDRTKAPKCRDEVQKRNMKRPKGHLMYKETIKNLEMHETIPSPKFGKI